jgi:hypothetical protein
MGKANFIKKRFLKKELYIYMGEEAETIALDQSWIPNKEIIHGIVLEVDVEDNVIVFEMLSGPAVYVGEDDIKLFWEKGFDYHKCAEGSMTKRLPGAKNKDR